MINEILDMVMKEARARPGDNLYIKAFLVLLELSDRLTARFNRGLEKAIEAYSKDGKIP